MEQVALTFRHPMNMIVAGPTGCGKTVFVTKMLRYRMLEPFPERIVVGYAEWQPAYEEWRRMYPHIEFVDDFLARADSIYASFRPTTTNLLILDDLMREASSMSTLMDLFTKGSHHHNLSILFLVQNIFNQGKAMRTVSLNTHYMTLFKNARDRMQAVTLGKQMYPECPHFVRDVVDDVSARDAHGYTVIDIAPGTPECAKVRTGIFPGEPTHCYLPAGQRGGRRPAGIKRAHSADSDDSDPECPSLRLIDH